MKTIIAGSRTITDYIEVVNAISAAGERGIHVTEVVSGGARGVDALGEKFARQFGLPIRRFPANWKAHGKAAGSLRNEEMAYYAEALIAVWDGQSRGTKHMIETANRRGLPVHMWSL